MKTHFANPVQYYMNIGGDLLCINELFGRELCIKHIGYQCVSCESAEPVFRMGFCKKCFFESPYASETILKPELSTAHLGIEERDLAVEKEIQLQPHFVYLAYTGDVKVGVTRVSQTPARWIDQGATLAVPFARTENRYEAGVIEVAMKRHFPDKTNYRKMLQEGNATSVDIGVCRERAIDLLPESSRKFAIAEKPLQLTYPYEPPFRINAFTLDKVPEFQGVLRGIKGQYLCFNEGDFINIRNHEGYVAELSVKG